jgi:hypothetical protein
MGRYTVPVSTTFKQLLNKILRLHLRGEKLPPIWGVAHAVNKDGDKVLQLVRTEFYLEGKEVVVEPVKVPDVAVLELPPVHPAPGGDRSTDR